MNPKIEAVAKLVQKTVLAAVYDAAILTGKSAGEACDHAYDAAQDAYNAVYRAAMPHPLRDGVQMTGEGSSCGWAVYDRRAVEAYLGEPGNTREAAEALTGWHSFYGGAGRGFAHDPYVKEYGSKLLVKQFRGLDI